MLLGEEGEVGWRMGSQWGGSSTCERSGHEREGRGEAPRQGHSSCMQDSVHAARVPHRRRVVGATPFLCRRILWWEQTPNDAGNGSSLTVGVGIVDIDAEATIVSGTIEWGREIGKAVSDGATIEERDGDRMKASSLRDERMGSNGRGGCGGGGNVIVLLLLCARLYGRLWQLLHATRRDGTRGAACRLEGQRPYKRRLWAKTSPAGEALAKAPPTSQVAVRSDVTTHRGDHSLAEVVNSNAQHCRLHRGDNDHKNMAVRVRAF
ncbi:hypothetical protein BHM03_00039210 [Ensete ventricosum]|nr:hypothetical protein BHM03_00039210 [Ensete ventricosum]